MRSIATFLLAAILQAPPASAALLRVPDDFPTIADALGAAAAGDTVEVGCGLYHEHDLVLPSGVTLISQTRDPSCVTIDADDLGRVMSCQGSGTTLIEGFTFTHGRQSFGGALYAEGGVLEIRRCDVVSNVAGGVGEIRGGGLSVNAVTLRLVDCSIVGNRAPAGEFGTGIGGGLHASASSVVIDHCTFTGNRASAGKIGSASGGAVYIASSELTVAESEFHENGASSLHGQGSGGAIAANNSSTSVSRCSFTDNAIGYSVGGALLLWGGSHDVSWSVFWKNRSVDGGQALYAGSGAVVHVENSTFVKNEGGGAQVTAGAPASLTMDRCIVAFAQLGGSIYAFAGATVSLSCVDIHGHAEDWNSSIAGQQGVNGNFSADPLFCGLEAGDLTLNAASPCASKNSGACGLIGALGVACGPTLVEALNWGAIKALYR